MSTARTRLQAAQVPGVYRRDVGSIRIATVHDGMLATSFDDIIGAVPKESSAIHEAQFRAIPPRFTCNIFVVETSDRLLLIDAGCGNTSPDAGKAMAGLASLGIAPHDVDAVIMTHLHNDHTGGLVTDTGSARFPNAELVMHEDELAFWKNPATRARLSASQQVDFDIAQTALAAYGNRMRTVADGHEAFAGITAKLLPGHTPGHTAWLIESAGDRLLIWGDVIHFPALQFRNPQVSVRYDFDPVSAAVSRRSILDMLAREHIPVAGVHLDFPCFGRVRADGDGFAYFPEFWTSDVPPRK